nr:MAG TPA: hypothetical protein [Caudoviricetes sp.]
MIDLIIRMQVKLKRNMDMLVSLLRLMEIEV